MNPKYLWVTETIEILTFSVITPVVATVTAYRAWRRREHNLNPRRDGMRGVWFAVAGIGLFGFAKWLDADVRTPQYFLQLASMLLSFLLLGVSMGLGFSVLLGTLLWHDKTRLH